MVAMAAIHALIHDASPTPGSCISVALHGPLDPETGRRRTSPVIRADELVQVEIKCNVNHDGLGINSRVLDGSISDAT